MLAMPVLMLAMPFVLECGELSQLGMGHRMVVRRRRRDWYRTDAHSDNKNMWGRCERYFGEDPPCTHYSFRQAYIDPPSRFGRVGFVPISISTTRNKASPAAQ